MAAGYYRVRSCFNFKKYVTVLITLYILVTSDKQTTVIFFSDTYVENFQEGTDEASSGSLIPKPSSLSGIPSLLGMDMEPPSSLKKTV